jgi:hypothetical protein
MTRTAIVANRGASVKQVSAYLPSNYTATEVDGSVVISGKDSAGWTLDGYVIPRLGSGMIVAVEVF